MIFENVQKVREKVASACIKTGRDASDVTLLAVSKTFSASKITEALRAGVNNIGENYVQELLRKKESVEDGNIRWHFIGHLQTNKVRNIASWIHLIHAVDSISLAWELDKWGAKLDRVIDALIEVNTTGEVTKQGIRPAETVKFVESFKELRHIRLCGLMTIGPFLPDPEDSRPMFRQLRLLKERLAQLGQENVDMNHLSMGMTGDYEVAIEEGATIIRVGTAIFGPRQS
jgi:pyridoxal phosphate enzyme (YggS family)